MNISTFARRIAIAVTAICCLSGIEAFAQANSSGSGMSPDHQMGVGITAGNSIGGHFAYAINPGFHAGAGFGIALRSESVGNNSYSGNTIWFAPYAKFIFSGMRDMKPYLFGSFGITSGKDIGVNTESSTRTGLSIGGGAEYFASRNIGIFGHVTVIGLGFGTNSTTNIGLISPQVGIEWFFNP